MVLNAVSFFLLDPCFKVIPAQSLRARVTYIRLWL
jgi:hypothetical protein